MGRVARLTLLVVVSVCVVFCVVCCLQNNQVFSSVTYLIISKMKIMSYVFWRVSLLRPEIKKVPVVCLAGCAVVSVFGSGDYDRIKKSYSHLSGGLCCCFQFLVLAGNWQFFCCGGKVLL